MAAETQRLPASAGASAETRSSLAFASADLHSAVSQFLAFEAVLLDQDRMSEWLDLLDDEFVYAVPLRWDRERQQGGNQFVPGSYRIHDSKAALRFRIERLLTGHAWVEELASRTSRLVGVPAVRLTDNPDVVDVTNSIIIYRQRGDQRDFEIIPARHEDRIRILADGSLRILRRTVFLTEKCLSTNNLAIVI